MFLGSGWSLAVLGTGGMKEGKKGAGSYRVVIKNGADIFA